MTRTKTGTKGDTAHEPVSLYSNNDAAKALGKSVATIKRYKRILSEAWRRQLKSVIDSSGAFTQQGIEELARVADFVGNGQPGKYAKILYAQRPELAHEPGHESGSNVAAQDAQEIIEDVEIINDEPGVINLVTTQTSVDLEKMRGQVLATRGVENLLAMGQEVLGAVDEAIDDDLRVQEAEVLKLRIAADEMKKKRSALQQKRALHQARTQRLQTKAILALEELREASEEVQEG